MVYRLLATAEATPETEGLFEALGIDWRLLIVQAISFLILLWVLKRFVYPPLLKAIDQRQATIEQAAQAAQQAQVAAEKAEAHTGAQLIEAKQQATEIVELARKEAAAVIEEADSKARIRADHLIASAEKRLAQDVEEAKAQLRAETLSLVRLATETMLNSKIDSAADTALIEQAIHKAEKAR